MPKYYVGFRDINGDTSHTKVTCSSDVVAANAAQYFANLSNAQVEGVYGSFPFVHTQLRPVGLANNVETIFQRAVFVFSGTDLGAPDNPNPEAVLKVPAPIGTLIEPNGTLGAAGVTFRDAVIGKFKNGTGVTMDTFVKAYYER